MIEFYKYLNPGPIDYQWGIVLCDAGIIHIPPGGIHPPQDHPNEYQFTWKRGRILHEYQLCYILEGLGKYEGRHEKFVLSSGSLMILKPNVWHRYKANKNRRWKSFFVGFSGEISDTLFNHIELSNKNSIINIGYNEHIIDCYNSIFNLIKTEKPGFQQIAGGEVMKLLGFVISINKQKDFSNPSIELIIQNARYLIRENAKNQIDFKSFADNNHLGYSYFRKMFKKYTGLPPVQFQINMRIRLAKEMLVYSNKSIKEISIELGFTSSYYFSRIFKQKVGITPTEMRKKFNEIQID